MINVNKATLEAVKEILRWIVLGIIGFVLTAGIDFVAEAVAGAGLEGNTELVVTLVIQVVLRGRDKYVHLIQKEQNDIKGGFIQLR